MRACHHDLPPAGQYAVGNVFMHPDAVKCAEHQQKIERIATTYGLQVKLWRRVPRDSAHLGTQSAGKEPSIWQPFVTMTQGPFSQLRFETQLYMLRKHSTHSISLKPWFYICSLNPHTIVYKGTFPFLCL